MIDGYERVLGEVAESGVDCPHGAPPAAGLRLSAHRRRDRAVDGRARQALSEGPLVVSTGQHSDALGRGREAFPTGSTGSRFPRGGCARIQGILLWSRRAAVLARTIGAEFIWCGNIKPAAYPAKWTMERTGTPFGILLHGGDLLILQHQVHQSALRSEHRARAALLGRRPGRQQPSGPGTAAASCSSELEIDASPSRSGSCRSARTTSSSGPGSTPRQVRERYGWPRDAGSCRSPASRRHKGIDTALQALARLRTSYPDLRYAVVGDGRRARGAGARRPASSAWPIGCAS